MRKGYKFSKEHKRKLSEALKGKIPKNLSLLHSPEIREKARLNRIKNGKLKGRIFSKETLKKMSLARMGRFTGKDSPNWKGGYIRDRRKDHICIDCGAIYKGKTGCNSKYCEQCRTVSCLCAYCLKEFFIKRKSLNEGRGIYCSLDCYRTHLLVIAPKGKESVGWKGGVSKDIRKYNRIHRANNRDKYRAYGQNRRALLNNCDGFHTGKEWEDLKKKYDYMCLCCKRQEPEIKLTEDHIIPISKGGSNYIDNIQPLCGQCNSRKYTKIINFIKQYEQI